jgi:serine/threonine protein kinase
LAPELVRGGDGDERVDTRGYDARAVDWWALGVMAFELTAGRPPFTAHNTHALYRSIAKNEPRYSSRFTDDLVSVLRDGFMRRDPSRRLGVGRSWSLPGLLGKGPLGDARHSRQVVVLGVRLGGAGERENSSADQDGSAKRRLRRE